MFITDDHQSCGDVHYNFICGKKIIERWRPIAV